MAGAADVGLVCCSPNRPLAAVVAWLKHAKLIVQGHGIEVWNRPAGLWRVAVKRSDLALCVSRYTRWAMLDWAEISPERVVVLPNTVRDLFTPGDGDEFRRSLGLQQKKVLLTVGRIDSRERYSLRRDCRDVRNADRTTARRSHTSDRG